MPTKEQDIVMTGVRSATPNRRLVTIVAVAAIAVVLGACAHPPVSGAPPAPGLVNAINAQRAANRRTRLVVDGGLTNYANAWAAHLAATGALEHQDLLNTIPGWRSLGETIEVGLCNQPDPVIVGGWMYSASHHAVLMSRAFRAVGVGKACGADGQEWVVADFGG